MYSKEQENRLQNEGLVFCLVENGFADNQISVVDYNNLIGGIYYIGKKDTIYYNLL